MMHACGVVLGGYSLPSEGIREWKKEGGRERLWERELERRDGQKI